MSGEATQRAKHNRKGKRPMVKLFLATLITGAVTVLTAGAGQSPAAWAAAPEEAAPVSAATAGIIEGIDVANYQHPGGAAIDWQRVASVGGKRFAAIKATEGPIHCTGSPYSNPWFASDWAGAGAAGMYRGAYHFAEPAGDPVQQAYQFVRATGSMNGDHDLQPALDMEVTCGKTPAELSAWAKTWIDEVKRLTGRTSMIYTYSSFLYDLMGGANQLKAETTLWLASYTAAPPAVPGWKWQLWQYTDLGQVPGINANVDLSRYYGTEAGLAQLTGGPTNPYGNLDDIKITGPGKLQVTGWTIDPDTNSPITAHVYLDGALTAVTANSPRPDVDAAYARGANHGYNVTLTGVAGGTHTICVYGINTGGGNVNAQLGCKSVTTGGNPNGFFDAANTSLKGTTVTGWALDPDTGNPIDVHMVVDWVDQQTTTANTSRPDVGAAYPGWGNNHGYNTTIKLNTGKHVVCPYAMNTGTGNVNMQLGCKTVTIGGAPGSLDQAVGGTGNIKLAGWALLPDYKTVASPTLYVDGTAVGGLNVANRADVAAAYGAPLANGFQGTITVAAGNHYVCVATTSGTVACTNVVVR